VAFQFTLSSYFQKHVIDGYNPVHVNITFAITFKSDLYIGMNVKTDLDISLKRDHADEDFRLKATLLDILILILVIVSSLMIFKSLFKTFQLAKVCL